MVVSLVVVSLLVVSLEVPLLLVPLICFLDFLSTSFNINCQNKREIQRTSLDLSFVLTIDQHVDQLSVTADNEVEVAEGVSVHFAEASGSEHDHDDEDDEATTGHIQPQSKLSDELALEPANDSDRDVVEESQSEPTADDEVEVAE